MLLRVGGRGPASFEVSVRASVLLLGLSSVRLWVNLGHHFEAIFVEAVVRE